MPPFHFRIGKAFSTAKWWAPTVSMLLVSLLSYVDRSVLAILAPTILHDTGLNAEQYGWMVSAFSAAYFVGNPAWGRVLDRYGVRGGMAAAVALWTCASVSHAFATTALAFAVSRAALGFGEGATFPGGLRTATQTLRPGERSRGVALAYSGGSLGAMVTSFVVMPVFRRWGWRGAFGFTGVLGASWLLLWARVSGDPRLRADAPPENAKGPRLRDPAVWGFMAAYALGAVPLGFVLYGAPIYLGRGLGCDQTTIGRVFFIPPLGWETGYFFWGWLVDRAARRGTLGRSAFGRLFGWLAVGSLLLAVAPHTHRVWAVLVLMFFAMFIASGFVIGSLADATRRHTGAHGAYLAGLGAGSWSGLMALLMPGFGRLFDRGAYGEAYAAAAVVPVFAWLVWRSTAGRAAADPGSPSNDQRSK